jgi:putative transposase
VVTPGARRAAALYLRQAYEMSERRACRVIGTNAGAWTPARTAPIHDCQRQRHRADLERHPGLGG